MLNTKRFYEKNIVNNCTNNIPTINKWTAETTVKEI